MNFPDYQRLNAEEPCCVTHQEVRTYLQNYAEYFDLLKHIQVSGNKSRCCVRKFLLTCYERYNVIVWNTSRIRSIANFSRRQRRMGCTNKSCKNKRRERKYL